MKPARRVLIVAHNGTGSDIFFRQRLGQSIEELLPDGSEVERELTSGDAIVHRLLTKNPEELPDTIFIYSPLRGESKRRRYSKTRAFLDHLQSIEFVGVLVVVCEDDDFRRELRSLTPPFDLEIVRRAMHADEIAPYLRL